MADLIGKRVTWMSATGMKEGEFKGHYRIRPVAVAAVRTDDDKTHAVLVSMLTLKT